MTGDTRVEKPEIVRISPVATRSCHERVAVIDRDLIQRKAVDAKRSARRRDIHNFHRADAEPLQRMLNAIQPGSYIRPHRHLDPPKAESLILLQGMLAHVVFGEDGVPELYERHRQHMHEMLGPMLEKEQKRVRRSTGGKSG